jgi:hypothetical protein
MIKRLRNYFSHIKLASDVGYCKNSSKTKYKITSYIVNANKHNLHMLVVLRYSAENYFCCIEVNKTNKQLLK